MGNLPHALFAFGEIFRSKVQLVKFTKCMLCVWESFRGSKNPLGEISGVSNFRLGDFSKFAKIELGEVLGPAGSSAGELATGRGLTFGPGPAPYLSTAI